MTDGVRGEVKVADGLREVVLRIAEDGGRLSAAVLGEGETVLASRLVSLEVSPDDPGITEAYGRGLTDAVLQGDLAEAIRRAEPARVRLFVPAGRADLLVLRWERLLAPGGPPRLPLSVRPTTPFSRFLGTVGRDRDPAVAWPLRIVVAISNPSDIAERYRLPAIDVDVELRELDRALTPLRGLVERVMVEPPVTLDRIVEALEAEPHVLHFLGHGFLNRETGGAALCMEDGQRRAVLSPDGEWTTRLRALPRPPHLVVLSACHSAAVTNAGALVGMAPGLIAAGAGAAVAMADRVEVDHAREFVFHFYRRLALHGEIDRAANEARGFLLDARGWAWSIPTAFVERGAERIFAAPPEPLEVPGAGPDETLILIAEFFGKGHDDELFEDELRIRLEEEVAAARLEGVRVAWLRHTVVPPGPEAEAEAHRIAARYGAALVIWGRYDSSGLRAFFTFTESLFTYRDPGAPRTATVREVFGPERDFAVVVNRDLPRHVEYFVFHTLAYLRYWSEDKDGALAALDRAIEAAEGSAGARPEGLGEAYFYRGNIHGAHRQDRPAAIADYRRALELRPGFGHAAFNLGEALRTLGNARRLAGERAGAEEAYRQAAEAYDVALSADPDDAGAHEGKGLARLARGEHEEALADFIRALERKPKAETFNRLAAALDALGRLEEARRALDEAVTRAPWACHYRFNRWRVLVRLGQAAAAEADAREYIRLCPEGSERDRLEGWLAAAPG